MKARIQFNAMGSPTHIPANDCGWDCFKQRSHSLLVWAMANTWLHTTLETSPWKPPLLQRAKARVVLKAVRKAIPQQAKSFWQSRNFHSKHSNTDTAISCWSKNTPAPAQPCSIHIVILITGAQGAEWSSAKIGRLASVVGQLREIQGWAKAALVRRQLAAEPVWHRGL